MGRSAQLGLYVVEHAGCALGRKLGRGFYATDYMWHHKPIMIGGKQPPRDQEPPLYCPEALREYKWFEMALGCFNMIEQFTCWKFNKSVKLARGGIYHTPHLGHFHTRVQHVLRRTTIAMTTPCQLIRCQFNDTLMHM